MTDDDICRLASIGERFLAEDYRERLVDLERIIGAARQQIVRYNGIRGRLRVDELSERERRALMGLLGRHIATRPGESLSLNVSELDEALRATGIADGLVTVVEAVLGVPLMTHAEQQAEREASWDAFLTRAAGLARRFAAGPAITWLDGIAAGASLSLPLIRREFARDLRRPSGPGRLAKALALVGAALAALPAGRGETMRLPVFAERICGDPHALDSGQLPGRLLIEALREVQAAPTSSRVELLATAGLLPDEVSSTVITFGLWSARCLHGGADPQVSAALGSSQVLVASLRQIRLWTGVVCPGNVLYAVENPAVFEELVDHLNDSCAPRAMICTSGFLSAAAWRMLELAVAGGAEVRYGGDFDANGLAIADGVLRRLGPAAALWRMSGDDYAAAAWHPLAEGLDGSASARLDSLTDPALIELAQRIRSTGKVAYQEALIERLKADFC